MKPGKSLSSTVKGLLLKLLKLHLAYESPKDAREHMLSLNADMSKEVADTMHQVDTLLTSSDQPYIGHVLFPCLAYSQNVYFQEKQRLSLNKSPLKPAVQKENRLDESLVSQFELGFKQKLNEEFQMKQKEQIANRIRIKHAANLIASAWIRWKKYRKETALKCIKSCLLGYLGVKNAWKRRTKKARELYLWSRLKHWYPILVAKFRGRHWKPYKDLAYYIGEIEQCVTIQRFTRGYIARKGLGIVRYQAAIRLSKRTNTPTKPAIWKYSWELDLDILTHLGNMTEEDTRYSLYTQTQNRQFEANWRNYEAKLRVAVERNLEQSKDWMEGEGWWTNVKLGIRQLNSPLASVLEKNRNLMRKKAEEALKSSLLSAEMMYEKVKAGAKVRLCHLKQGLKSARVSIITR